MEQFFIETKNLSYTYGEKTPFETIALQDVSVSIRKNSFTCIIGHTGCGKSTLIQHFNGLLSPKEGTILIEGKPVKKSDVSLLRQRVGLLFQYPEHQLFEATVYKDIAFGLKKAKLTEEETDRRVKEAITAVGLPEEILERSIYSLSGGQKRRIAIAGVLVMQPELLILDEPAAGLDPQGRDEILSMIARLHKEKNMTVVLVSHSMEDVAKLADYIIVMNKGKVELEGTPKEVFPQTERLEEIGLSVPQVTYLMKKLHALHPQIVENCFTVEEAAENILAVLGGKGNVE